MTPQDPSPSEPRRLRRSSDRRVAGVAGGIADTFGLDATLVRVAFVILAFFGGAGLAAYVVGAFVVPDAEDAPPLSARAQVVLAVIGVAALLSAPFSVFLIVPVALGVLVWRAFGGRVPGGLLRASLIVVAVVGAVVVGIAAGASAAFGGGTVVAVLVILTGLALIFAGLRGGARWLILPALLLVAPVSVVSAADLDLEGGVGEREYRPGTVSEIRPSYELGVGELEIDLRAVDFADAGEVTTAARVGVGRVEVLVPDGVCVRATADAGIGEVDLLGRVNEGVDVDGAVGGEAPAGTPTVIVDLDASVGELIVGRSPRYGGFDRFDRFEEEARLEDDGCA